MDQQQNVDRFTVAKYGKAVQLGCDYTEGEMVMITASQVMQVCKFDLAHSYVNVRHKLYKRGLGEGPGMKSGLGTIYYYFPDFAYETKNLRQRMSAL